MRLAGYFGHLFIVLYQSAVKRAEEKINMASFSYIM